MDARRTGSGRGVGLLQQVSLLPLGLAEEARLGPGLPAASNEARLFALGEQEEWFTHLLRQSHSLFLRFLDSHAAALLGSWRSTWGRGPFRRCAGMFLVFLYG